MAVVELLQAHLATQTVAQVRSAPGPSLPIRNEKANPVVQPPSQSGVLNTRSSQHSIETSSLPAVPASDAPAQTPDTLSHDLKSNTWIPLLENSTPAPRTPFSVGGAFTYRSHTGPLPEFSAQAFLSSLAKKL
ncbi:hypothetical protein L873DRAFT_1808243 [Choiromyces venosus 120613-1]|uniref:Uncharacterized protein n=1 Tax=Choiromyces venosus 120613-1 TaxID=1336337 RepID=A0A3N4JM13_9PEZI|nr:hypothetical protein L873DRAFT_1808243 [Choiromyces venosus 120613-1]